MLPPIPTTRNERREQAQLRRFAQSITSIMIAERASVRPAPLIGGTALRLLMGLSRPSTDLDFCGASLDGRTLNQITRAIENAGHEVTGHVGVSHKPSRCELHIRSNRSFLGFRPHVRTLNIDLGMPIALPEDLTEVQAGILSPRPEKLLDLKLDAFCGERHRTEIRDLYDATWIHERFPDRVQPARSHAFAIRAADALTDRNRSRWRRLQAEDRFLSRIQWPALEESVRETIDAVYERHGPLPPGPRDTSTASAKARTGSRIRATSKRKPVRIAPPMTNPSETNSSTKTTSEHRPIPPRRDDGWER